MSKALKPLGLALALLTAAPGAWAFSLLGPQEAYQVEALGYAGPFGLPVDYQNWVKNIDDDYRWNTKVLYYSYDPEFISYFGSNGIAAIDGAMAILNNLTNASKINLTDFPLESKSVNYTASALNLFDLKSIALQLMVERYGLGDPDHFTWTLRNRSLPSGAQCPAYVYSVIKRNFDPITWEYSSYVNGNLFTYQILEGCPTLDSASAEEVLVDPFGTVGSALASLSDTRPGEFFRGLTRDDVGGIRYLLATNNINWEPSPAGGFIWATNTSQSILVFPSNLQLFAEQALTNDAGALQALYPGLLVTGTSNYFVNAVQTNVVSTLTTSPYAPVGSPPTVVWTTNYTTSVATRYVHTFGNVLTNQYGTSCPWSLLTTNITPSPYGQPGSGVSVTNVTIQNYVQPNTVCGSFFILPTNLCGYQILSTQLVQLVVTTNFLTNTFTTFTNAVGTNSLDYYEYSQSVLTYFTNTILVAYPVTCPENIITLFEGIEKITFVRRDFDSLLGQFFQPITNNFTLTEITNNTRKARYVQRAVTTPDIRFTADDIISDATLATLSTPNYVTPTNSNPRGPGIITPGISITFSKVGSFLINSGPSFLTETSGTLGIRWGSFDGSTNAPVVYPVGTDLQTLETLSVFGLSQPSTLTNGTYLLPNGTNGVPYQGTNGFQLLVMGGTPPYSWDQASILPAPLRVSASGVISGTPASAGIFYFTARMTDAAGRFVDFPFTLTIQP